MKRAILVPIMLTVVFVVAVEPAAAADAGNDLWLPAVGTGPGVPPSYWYTTIWVFNPNEGPAEVMFSFLRRNQANDPGEVTHSMVVQPGAVAQIDDAVTTMFGVEGFGAIHAVADLPVHVTARIYSKPGGHGERDSAGQAFVAVPAERAIGAGDEVDVIGLTNLVGGDFRYNVGFVETTGQATYVQVSLNTSSGSSWVSNSLQLQPFEQRQMSVDQLFNNVIGESDNFRLHVIGGPGEGRVIVFGSRVANGSQDATTFEMSSPPTR